MKYKYISDVKAKDLWILAMRRTYKGFLGIINVVFTVSVIIMTISLFESSGIFFRTIMIILCLIFPLIQPVAVYGRSVRQLEGIPKDLELSFDESGVHISCGGASEDIKWSGIENAIKQFNMIVIMSDQRHGYIITDRVLGTKKEEFYNYLCKKITENKKH